MRSVTATPTVCKKQVRKHSFMILIYTCFAYLPNAHAIAPNNEDVIAASPPDVKIGTTNFCKKNKPHKISYGIEPSRNPIRLIYTYFVKIVLLL